MKKILITGASGFAGRFLCEHLLKDYNYQVYGTFHTSDILRSKNILKNLILEKIDLLNKKQVNTIINKIKPDIIIHLAGSTSSQDSFQDPHATIYNNITTQINLLESIRLNHLFLTKILIVSSGEIYGHIDRSKLPVDEDAPLRPSTPYAVSKLTQDFLGLQYFLAYKLLCIRVRPFNHIGPRQASKFIVSDFARQIAEIEKGLKKPVISVGNLESERDYTDVRDIVKAYAILVEKGIPGEVYNIGSGRAVSAGKILDNLLKLSPLKIKIKKDPRKFRPADTPLIYCTYKKFHNLSGWTPEIRLSQSLSDTLDYWRMIV